jgi:hypothetical protein
LLGQQVRENWGVKMEELRSGSRKHVVLKAQGEFSHIAAKGLGYSGFEGLMPLIPTPETKNPVVALNSAPGFTPLEIMPRSVSSRNDWNF